MDKETYQELLDILNREVKPALGCTGPIGICYGSAEAYDAVRGGEDPENYSKGRLGVRLQD